MKVTVCFQNNIRVVVPCGDGSLLVRDLMHEAILRYKKATGKNDISLSISSLSSLNTGGILDPDDRLCDVADDREQIVAHLAGSDVLHIGGDGASSVGTNSPDFFHAIDNKEHRIYQSRSTGNIKRESTKRLSMHVLSSREPCLTSYSALSLPRESRRKEPLGQDSKALYEISNLKPDTGVQGDIHEIIIKNEAGSLGLHVVPCYDLLGNDQGLQVEGIEPNGRIAKDGQIDLHDKIIKINGHNLLRIPFSKVQEIFRVCMNEPCLKISIVKHNKPKEKNVQASNNTEKSVDNDESFKRLQCTNQNVLQTANTRKIGKMIDIELTKGNNGLGFSVTTRDNPAGGHCPIYIKNILPKGAAVEDGRLKPGDRLLEVNNLEMTGKSQNEVVALLRSIPPGGKVHLVVSRQEEVSTNTSDSNVGVPIAPQDNQKNWKLPPESPTKKKDELPESYEKCSYKTVQVREDLVLSPRKNRVILTLDIPVHDSEKAGLGVSVKGKTSTSEDSANVDLGIFIKSVLNGGAASRDGRLRMNDQLLNVNGISLLGLSNSDAMETLRRAMLSTSSSITGVITLTIARRVSAYENSSEKGLNEKFSSSKAEVISNVYGSNSKLKDRNIKDKNLLNSQTDILDNGLLSPSSSPWNPVIDRLTEQYNKNSLRNESYCIATNKSWMDPVSIVKKLSIGQQEDRLEAVLQEESGEQSQDSNIEPKKSIDEKDSQYSGDPAYDSQLSLEEFSSPTNKFSRDALGRQSMSEKRHAALDAKNTDTYKRNKKLRESRENSNKSEEQKSHSKKEFKDSFETTNSSKSSMGETSKHSQHEYLYTVPAGNSKTLPPRKHWLVDDVHTGNLSNNSNNSSNSNKEDQGFSNSRGDFKQASLHSALDDRYKRSKKKTGLRSMLRLGKNRKSLNFGDNESRLETGTYCSGTINYIA